jgi:glutamyl-tRNA synthetase
MNGRYMRELPLEDLHRRLEEFYGRELPLEVVAISREKMQTLADFWELAGSLIEAPTAYQEKAWQQWGASSHMVRIREALAAAPEPFGVGEVESVLRSLVDELGVKPKEVFQPIRVALTGTTVSPGIFESVAALGRDETLSRLEKALRKAESEPSSA